MNESVRVLLVDDHPLVRVALAGVIAAIPGLTVCGEADSASRAIDMYRSLRPDLVLMDLRLKGGSGARAIAAIREESPDARIVVISSFASDEDVHAAVDAGARGYVLKTISADELVAVIRSVLQGEIHFAADVASRLADPDKPAKLTQRERDILQLVAQGKSNREIGDVLTIGEGTVKWYVASILSKLGAAHRTAAAMVGIERGIIQPEN